MSDKDEIIKNFLFHVPVELVKSESDEEAVDSWQIQGIASTDEEDLQGEVVNQDGLDISLLKAGRGLFNYDHQKGPENILGQIEEADFIDQDGKKALFVKGYLFKNSERGKAFYNILKSLKKGTTHRVHFSIEGKILRRSFDNPKHIANARIDKVALTFDPVNPVTYCSLVKSLQALNKGEVEMPASQAVNEHKHLVQVLESKSHKDDKKEAKKQKKELEEYKKELGKKDKEDDKEKEAKKSLFPEGPMLIEADIHNEDYKKSSAFYDLLHLVRDLDDLRSLAYTVQNEAPEAKEAFELRYKSLKKEIEKKAKVFEKMSKSINLDKDIVAKLFEIAKKSLAVGAGYAGAPGNMTGGAAMGKESLEKKPDPKFVTHNDNDAVKKKKKVKKSHNEVVTELIEKAREKHPEMEPMKLAEAIIESYNDKLLKDGVKKYNS